MDDGLVHRIFDADLEVVLLDRDEQLFQCQVVDRRRCLLNQFSDLVLMITFVLVDCWACCKSQDRPLKDKTRYTFKSHICAGWKLVSLKRLLELILQGSTSDLYILLLVFVRIIDLRDEIVEFREDSHNRNFMLWSVTMRNSEIANNYTIPANLLIEEPLFQSQ